MKITLILQHGYAACAFSVSVEYQQVFQFELVFFI